MFCSKCGKEINDEAVVCPSCGCATANFSHSPTPQKVSYSNDYLRIHEFFVQATTIRNLGIAAAILMFGIGIIFSIIIWVKEPQVQVPEVSTVNPNELAELEDGKRRLQLGQRLASLPIIAIGVCIAIVSIAVIASV